MAADFLAELVVPIAPEPGRPASLRFPLRIPPIASTSWAHFDRSDASWRRPAAVSRYTRVRWLLSETFQAAPIHLRRSRRCSAGYSEPVSTWSTSLEFARMACAMP
jgi:hypothetical protein